MSSSSTSSTLGENVATEASPTAAEKRRSVESFDLGGDPDLEARLEGTNAPKSSGEAEKGAPVPAAAPAGPATLAHDDPENPRNWKTSKKVLINFVLCIWVLSLTYASTAYVASVPAIEEHYHISLEATILGVTLMVIGFAGGPLIMAPASELFGRRIVYIVSGICYSAFSFGAAFAPNAGALLTFRFLLGFFGASSINNVPASIGDYTVPANRNQYSILYALMAFGGPALGPLCSSFIETRAGFQWNMRTMAIFSTTMSLLVAFVPETHGPTLLKQRIKREGNAPPPLAFNKVIGTFKVALARPLLYLFTEPIVTLVSVYLSFLYAILYTFFECFTIVYLDIRHFDEENFGLTYISLGIGFLVACVLLATVGRRIYESYSKEAESKGLKVQPEARLGLAYFGAILAPISLFMFAWTAPFPHIHWAVPCLAELLFAVSMLTVFTAFIPYLIDCYLMTAASALAAGMASRALLGGCFPLFALQMYHKMSVQGATSFLAGITVLLAPIPFVFNKYGRQLRERSKYAIMY